MFVLHSLGKPDLELTLDLLIWGKIQSRVVKRHVENRKRRYETMASSLILPSCLTGLIGSYHPGCFGENFLGG